MRLCYFLLAAGIGLLACSEASPTESETSSKLSPGIIDSVPNYDISTRFLRTGQETDIGTTKDDEERALSIINGILLDKAATNAWLKFFLERGLTVKQVKKKYLMMSSRLSFDDMLEHPNWKALAKYQRMQWEHTMSRTWATETR